MFTSVDDIEYEYNLDFLPEITNKYNTEIIDIFNGDLSNYSIYEINHPEIIIILAIYYNCNNNKERAINILINIGNYPRALCTLGVLYKQNDDIKSIECFIKAADMGDKNAINNLAYQYYLMNNIEQFFHYNNLLDDDKKLVNLALFELNINHDYQKGLEYIKEACNYNSFRAYYIYAHDFLNKNNINIFYENLFNGFKLKPRKQYIDLLIKNTTPELRVYLCYKYNYSIELFRKYDNSILKDITCEIIKDKVCPVCLNKNINIKLKCLHSFCESCFIHHKKCILCVN
jgi:hypothetical protein